jgi:hypothetical protein
VQIYTCAQTAAGPAWRLKAPDAALLDAAGHVAGHHFAGAPFAGPTWRAADGSSVTAARLAESPSPAAGAIPWLILRATAHGGAGVFAAVAYIVRSQTEGGAAPKAGCDAAHRDAETRVPYSATYSFFPG